MVGFEEPSEPTRTHWKTNLEGTPSVSSMSPVPAVSRSPARATPEIVGVPVAASFTGVTLMIMVKVSVLSDVPSFTLKVRLA